MPVITSQDISQDISIAAQFLSAGALVIIPTETVYGLGADARNEEALQRIYTAKRRPAQHPIIVHIENVQQLSEWAVDISPLAHQLAAAFWPGPLTLVFKKHPQVSSIITGGQDTIAVRIPNHPVALALLREFGDGIAAPSANIFTQLSPTTTAAIDATLRAQVAMILEGGACTVGLESTIIDVSGTIPRILRPGMISAEAIQTVIPAQAGIQSPHAVRVPGMHQLHYAPQTKTRLLLTEDLLSFDVTVPTTVLHHSSLNTSRFQYAVQMPDEPAAYARVLYQRLHEADRAQVELIVIEAVPSNSAWDAIRDRITKASAR